MQSETRISFASTHRTFPPVIINEKATDVVSTVKLLGLKISNELRWNYNVTEISKKVSGRSILSKVVEKGKRRVQRPRDILHHLYSPYNGKRLRSLSQWSSCGMCLSDELEYLQKRALRIIYRYVSYRDASSDANLGSLANRRSAITAKLLADIISKQDHKLRHLLPPPNK